MSIYFAIALVVAACVSWALCRLLIATGPRDYPSEARKAHATPTPTSGGLAVWAGAGCAFVLLLLAPEARTLAALEFDELWPLAVFPLAFLLIGFLDDSLALAAHVKAPLFVVLSITGAMSAGVVDTFPLEADAEFELPKIAGLLGTALWIFTLVNAVNFIDGANGLAAGSIAIAVAGAGAIAWMAGDVALASATACLVAAICGFLLWNFPHGRIFAGDAGALSLGALGALLSLSLIERVGVSPFTPPILFFPLIADVLLTMLWRARCGAPLMQAHSDHFYQAALKASRSHALVAVWFWVATAVCAGIAIFVTGEGDAGMAWKALAALALASLCFGELARRRMRRRAAADEPGSSAARPN